MPKRTTLVAVALLMTFLPVNSIFAKGGIPKVKPVVIKDIEYRIPNEPQDAQSQPGGYIEAWNSKENKKLWEVKVYDVKFKSDAKKEDQTNYIRSLKIDSENLVVQNETGETYEVDPAKKTIKQLSQEPSTSKPTIKTSSSAILIPAGH